jgi:hypothetical protein
MHAGHYTSGRDYDRDECRGVNRHRFHSALPLPSLFRRARNDSSLRALQRGGKAPAQDLLRWCHRAGAGRDHRVQPCNLTAG